MVDYQGCNSRNSGKHGWQFGVMFVVCVGVIFWCAAIKIHDYASSSGSAAPTADVVHQPDRATHEGVQQ